MRLFSLRRWRLWFALFLLAIAIGVASHPSVYWPTWGWLLGEAWFDGWPTSYWEREVAAYQETIIAPISGPVDGPSRPLPVAWSTASRPSLVEIWLARLTGKPLGARPSIRSPLEGDPAALPVLAEMAKSGSPQVRRVAAYGFLNQYIWPELPRVPIEAMRRLSEDLDPRVSRDAARYLEILGADRAKLAFAQPQ